jgi:membrane protein DedA with SNARE-associated domain
MDIKVLSTITPFINQYGYIAIILSTALEGTSIPFPGSVVLILVGFIIYKGGLNIWYAIFLGGLFYSLASIVPYYIGKNIKGSLFNFLEIYCKVPRKRITTMEEFFYKHGEFSICISRPFFIGNYVSYFAGIANINIFKFFILTFIGILPWTTLYLWLGYYFRGNINRVYLFLEKYNITTAGVLIFIIMGIIIVKKYIIFEKKKNY